jgi:hypothetical protein
VKPWLALLGALFGLGAFGAYESQLFFAAQALVVIAVIGHGLSYLRHRKGWLLASAIASGIAVFAGLYWAGSEALVYAGFAGLVAAMPVLELTITCPRCDATRTERMPIDACRFFYECAGCRATLRPKPGDCCVFCSYGSVKCPPMQAAT